MNSSPNYDLPLYIERWRLRLPPSQQRRGLADALGDLSEDGFDLTPEERVRIDNTMKAENLITLSEIQAQHGARIRRLLKKKKLVHEDDAIALKGFLDANLLNDTDAEIANRLIEGFSPKQDRFGAGDA